MNDKCISKSLLEAVVVRPERDCYKIGMDEWIEPHLRTYSVTSVPEKEANGCSSSSSTSLARQSAEVLTFADAPLPKKLKLDRKPRFYRATEQELSSLSKPSIPPKTEDATKWALQNFNSWVENRNVSETEQCPPNLLHKMDPLLLNKWLSVFVTETRKVNGDRYPPTTLQSILSGLLRHMRKINPQQAPNIFAKNNPQFETLHRTMDSVYRSLRIEGVGAVKHSAEVINKDEENILWTSGVLSCNNPTSLLRAVFFYNGKNFLLRGGTEHRNFSLSQLQRVEDGYIYTENASKNRPGGLALLKVKNKSVKIVATPEAGDRCHCHLLDTYIRQLPEEAKKKDLFYVKPLQKFSGRAVWYSPVPLGRNKLAKMVAEMCEEAGIKGRKTNHSLRATGATELYTAGVPEKIIQERTGHRSLECLRMYEKTSEKQQKAVSKILSSSKETTFNMELNNTENTSMLSSSVSSLSSMPMTFNSCSVTINYNINQGPTIPTKDVPLITSPKK